MQTDISHDDRFFSLKKSVQKKFPQDHPHPIPVNYMETEKAKQKKAKYYNTKSATVVVNTYKLFK